MSAEYIQRIWAVVPAAGLGHRMGSALPKQYLDLEGRTVLEHTLERLAGHRRIRGLVVVLSEGDHRWGRLGFRTDKPVICVTGGAQRSHSVLNGLGAVGAHVDEGDWVLVHDAARPCVRAADIDALLDALADHPVGGLLGHPVRDTMKRAAPDGSVESTVERRGLWHALTPQVFRCGALRAALEHAVADEAPVTDEAEAMEREGWRPRLVEGHGDNIKITHPGDLRLAAFYLAEQGREPRDHDARTGDRPA